MYLTLWSKYIELNPCNFYILYDTIEGSRRDYEYTRDSK